MNKVFIKKAVLFLMGVFLLLQPLSIHADEADATVSMTIGTYQFNLSGYTSPFAKVTIEGNGIFDQTIADSKGYFEFKNRFSPFSPKEACITAQDQLGRNTQPVCLPPFPTHYNVNVGPVLLPPTVSFNKGTYYVRDQVVLTGQTIPNARINFSVFKDKNKLLQVINPNSFSFPKVDAKADNKGNFSISLPSSTADAYRLFSQAFFKDAFSPKSITLHFDIYPIWMIIVTYLIMLWGLLVSRLLEIVILINLIALTFFVLRKYFHPHTVRSLMVYTPHDLSIYRRISTLTLPTPHELMKRIK